MASPQVSNGISPHGRGSRSTRPRPLYVFTYKTVEQGAATSIVAAVSPAFAHSGGHYLDDTQEAYTVPSDADLAQHPHGVKEWALDPATAERLWAVSTELLCARVPQSRTGRL